VEGHQPLRCDAAHLPAADGPRPGQRVRRVALAVLRRAVDAASVLGENDDVEVDPPAAAIAEHEVPRAGVAARHGRKSAALERADGRGDVVFLDGDVEVAVAAGLRAQARVDRPAAVQPYLDAGVVHERQEPQNVVHRHLGCRGRLPVHGWTIGRADMPDRRFGWQPMHT
jgi:hypothetical protein